MAVLLNDSEIAGRLKRLRGWKHEGAFIAKIFKFKEFVDGIAFVDSIAKIAEEEGHHPDIDVRYTTVRLCLQTHSEGGVTELDFGLAGRIEGSLERRRRTSVKRRYAPIRHRVH